MVKAPSTGYADDVLGEPRAYWARCLPALSASPVPVSACDNKRLKMNNIQLRTHLTGSLSVVTNLPVLVSCLLLHG